MAVKDNHYLAMVRAVFNGDTEHARSLMKQESARALSSRPMFHKRLEAILQQRGGQLIELQKRGRWEFGESTVSLGDLILTGAARVAITRVLKEYARREQLEAHQLSPSHKILLEGPPGNGKSSIALGVAHTLGLPVARISCHDIIASHLGESGANLKDLFRESNRSPCVVFLDEIDGLSMSRGGHNGAAESERTSITTSLFILLDGLSSRTVLIAATNRIEDLDPALIRRFDVQVMIPAPSEDSAEAWIEHYRRTRWPELDIEGSVDCTSFASLERDVVRQHREWVMNATAGGEG
jgi:SpoVK/Ycf46/Vps4 family AAA+-type ATPase